MVCTVCLTHWLTCDRVASAGFNPVWDELLTIPVHMPDFCLLDLVVRDHSTTGSNYILGHYCIHFDDLMPGERHTHTPAAADGHRATIAY